MWRLNGKRQQDPNSLLNHANSATNSMCSTVPKTATGSKQSTEPRQLPHEQHVLYCAENKSYKHIEGTDLWRDAKKKLT